MIFLLELHEIISMNLMIFGSATISFMISYIGPCLLVSLADRTTFLLSIQSLILMQ
jgi:hypothetical protein